MDMYEKIGMCFIGAAVALTIFSVTLFIPVAMYNRAKCLEEGYPRATTTFTLQGYCIGLEGNTSTIVKKL